MDKNTWGLVRDGRAPLVGRDAESRRLDAALEAVLGTKDTRVVTLLGPAGIGKSRLIQDFVIRHRAVSLVPRVYRGSARDASSAYGIFGRLLRARFGLVEGMDPEAAKAQVRQQVARVLDDRKVGDVAFFLGQFLDLPFEESPLTRALQESPEQAEIVRRAVMKSFFESDAASSPLCLVLEDLHVAHDDAISLVRYLLANLTGPILVLCAARTDFLAQHDDWSSLREDRHEVIELPPLADADAAKMMEHLLAPCVGGAPVELVEAACTFANGSPLLLEQMVRVYHDTGVLCEEDALSEEMRWKVDLDKLHSVRLPLTIEEAVNARLAALEPEERELLEQAAVMGSVFYSGALRSLWREGREAPPLWNQEAMQAENGRLDRLLADLVERDYVLRMPDSSFPGSDELIFKHNKEREFIQKRTNASTARRYHRALADWLDNQPMVRASDEYLAMLADHRERGGDPVGAGVAYLDAGDIARSRYANARASELYEKGLTLVGESCTSRRIEALHNAGDVLHLLGRVDDALASFREMLTLAYRLDLKAKAGAAHNRIGRLHREIGSLDEAQRHLATALELFQAAHDERGVASTIDDIGKLHWLRGDYHEALFSLRDGLTRRRRLADRRGIALSLNNVGLVLADSGELQQAVEVFEQSLRIRREIGDLPGVTWSLVNLGEIAQGKGDLPAALQLFEEALDVAKQVGDRNRIAVILTHIGEARYRAGSPERAIEVLQQAEALCDEAGDKLGLAMTLRGLGKAHLLRGDLPKARDCIGRAVDLFASVRSKVHLGTALRTLGEITAAGGWGSVHTRSAREYFARSAEIFEQTGNEVELAHTLRAYGKFLTTDPGFADDERARADAVEMERRAKATYDRLAATSLPRLSFASTPDAAPSHGGAR